MSSLRKRLEKIEADATSNSGPRFWGPPRSDADARARYDAGLTPDANPAVFWTDTDRS